MKDSTEFEFSKLKLTQGSEASDYRTSVEMEIDEDAGSDELLLTLTILESLGGGEPKDRITSVEYLSEKQILEMYFYLKASLIKRFGSI